MNFEDCSELGSYRLNNSLIQTKQLHKHLGYILDNKQSNNDLVENVFNSSLRKWHFLLKLFPYA